MAATDNYLINTVCVCDARLRVGSKLIKKNTSRERREEIGRYIYAGALRVGLF